MRYLDHNLMFELGNYEDILREAIDSNNDDILEFCKKNIYPCYIDVLKVAEIDPDIELFEVFSEF